MLPALYTQAIYRPHIVTMSYLIILL